MKQRDEIEEKLEQESREQSERLDIAKSKPLLPAGNVPRG